MKRFWWWKKKLKKKKMKQSENSITRKKFEGIQKLRNWDVLVRTLCDMGLFPRQLWGVV